MKSVVEHEACLTLETGIDRVLVLSGHVFALAGVAGFLLSPASTWLKILEVCLCLITGVCVDFFNKRLHHGQLLVFPDGSAKWQDKKMRWHHGAISAHAWSSRQYAVVRGTSYAGNKRFLISRSRQHAGSYRILLSWLRLKAWDGESELAN